MTRDPARPAASIVTVNTGSSSLKLALYADGPDLTRRARVTVERIGSAGAVVTSGSSTETVAAGDHAAALAAALDRVERIGDVAVAIGHRVVHGGAHHAAPERVTATLVADLRRLAAIDPDHAPQAIAALEACARRFPGVPQVVCFDTAFHRSMPPVARRYPLPRWTEDAGIERYGFHGLSCESILSALGRLDPAAAAGRILIAHLGSGASITAVRGGASVDTTMGFSPTGGLMMSTRCGDLDPVVATTLARAGKSAEDLERLFTRGSGLLGVSGASGDLRDLAASPSPAAAAAIDLFCYLARKHMGAMAAALEGVDTIVFTGGIGEHAADVRARICAGLSFLGVELDQALNASHAPLVSTRASRVAVRVMETDEDLVIARHVRALMA
jgi:acetate kinase